jgi:hypothetical protein
MNIAGDALMHSLATSNFLVLLYNTTLKILKNHLMLTQVPNQSFPMCLFSS